MDKIVQDFLKAVQEERSDYAYGFADLYKALFIAPFDNPISLVFILLIGYIFISAIFLSHPSAIGWERMRSTLPIGILGTFIGVLVAVTKFTASPDNITQSLNDIIQGLKIAFSTSIYGLGEACFYASLKRVLILRQQK